MDFLKFLSGVALLVADVSLLIFVIKKIVYLPAGGNWISKRWAMMLETGFIGFIVALFGFPLCLSILIDQKWLGVLAFLVVLAGIMIGWYAGIGGMLLLLTGKNRQDIRINSKWDFWKFLR